jgi:hypothetical protein
MGGTVALRGSPDDPGFAERAYFRGASAVLRCLLKESRAMAPVYRSLNLAGSS